MVYPPLLRAGDTVALLAASSPGTDTKERLKAAVRFYNDAYQLTVDVYESCHAQNAYLAGDDALRARDIQTAFADPSVKALFFWRGGYGMQRILPLLDYAAIRRNPKIVAGYSDVTALHLVLNQNVGLVTFHTPMPGTELYRASDDFTLHSYRDCLQTDGGGKAICNPSGHPLRTITPGRTAGRLAGGNLSLVAASLGTPYEIDTRDTILFLEDVQEPPYRVDRMLLQLKLAGKFRACNGIVLGSFAPETYETLRVAVDDLIASEQKPAIFGLACGHCEPTLSLRLGATVVMDADSCALRYD